MLAAQSGELHRHSVPLVSVITLFHRVTPYLRLAVRSIIEQTERDWELLLVDNGTGVGLSALGDAASDPRIRLISHAQHVGVAEGNNSALAVAQGEFVALLDHDDIALPRRLEKQVALLRAQPHVGLVGSMADSIDESGAVIGRQFTLETVAEHFAFTAYTTPVNTPTLTGRRELFQKFTFRLGLNWATDYDFQSRVSEVTGACALPEVLGQYRMHRQQATSLHFNGQVLSACLIRIMTARRRCGRAEGYAELLQEYSGWIKNPPPLPECFRHFAERSLRENFPRLTVYFARKLLGVRRRPVDVNFSGKMLLAACRLAPADQTFLLRLFFTGPVRAHGLKRLK